MAVAVREALTEVDRVADAVVETYRRSHEEAHQAQLVEFVDVKDVGAMRTIACPQRRTVEIVLDAELDAGSLVPGIWRLGQGGHAVVVLVALGRIGAAHPELRGVPCRLQAYWLEGERVCFGGFEVP